jgi:hypothetical protein
MNWNVDIRTTGQEIPWIYGARSFMNVFMLEGEACVASAPNRCYALNDHEHVCVMLCQRTGRTLMT